MKPGTISNGRAIPPAAVRKAVSVLMPHWTNGARHILTGPLAGLLLRRLPLEEVEGFVEALCREAGDADVADRLQVVRETAKRLKAGETVTGAPTLARALGDDGERVVWRLRVALGFVITLKQLAASKGLPVAFLKLLGLENDYRGVLIPYKNAAGRVVARRLRTAIRAKDGSYWQKGTKVVAYGLDRLAAARDAGSLILVEGESDCWALWHGGFHAIGVPGAGMAKTLMRNVVNGIASIYVLQEPDAGGQQFAVAVGEQLAVLGWRGTLRVVRLERAKDAAELYVLDPAGFKLRFQEALDRAETVTLTAGNTARAPEPYVPFPVEHLPEPVQSLVREGAEALACDPCFVALPALAVVAGLIGNARTVRVKPGWDEPSVVWAAVVADSGTVKSPAARLALAPVYRAQRRLLDQHKAALLAWEAVKAAHEKASKAFAKGAGPDPGPLPDKPVCRRLVCGDITIERLTEILQENPRGILVHRDELAGWVGSFARYRGKSGGSDLPAWLEMHRAETVIVDRKGDDRKTVFVPRAAVSVGGSIQPGTLARVLATDEALEAGLLARVLLARPPRTRKCWTDAEVSPAVRQQYEELVSQLPDLPTGQDENGAPVPVAVPLDPAARRKWVKFYNAWAQEQAEATGPLAAALSKLEGYAARLALVHHVVTRAASGTYTQPIGADSMRAGITLAKWFGGEARRLYAELVETEEERRTRQLTEYIVARGGSVTTRELQRSGPTPYRAPGKAEAALEALVKAETAHWQTKAAPKGGRPARTCVLRHPYTADATGDTCDTCPASAGGATDDGSETLRQHRCDTTSTDPQNPGVSEGSVATVSCRNQVTDGRTEGDGVACEVVPGGAVVSHPEDVGVL
jgi:hypothetical protein